MKLSKEQIAVLAENLNHPWGRVTLLCDGHRISLEVARTSAKSMSYRVMTYVNGFFRGTWIMDDKPCPEQKFLRKAVKPRCSPARKREAEKALGKRYVKSHPYYSETSTTYWPDWANGKAALNHLNKVCESVQLTE
ncbi:MAG: hypothetical protein OEV31_06340 [Gammaproteobacteria bacterium]|nr:hypothetical protein [Gammaproteobacteria bacterium]